MPGSAGIPPIPDPLHLCEAGLVPSERGSSFLFSCFVSCFPPLGCGLGAYGQCSYRIWRAKLFSTGSSRHGHRILLEVLLLSPKLVRPPRHPLATSERHSPPACCFK